MNPRGYHLLNVILHVANAVTFYSSFAAPPRGGHGGGRQICAASRRRCGGPPSRPSSSPSILSASSRSPGHQRRDVQSGFFYLASDPDPTAEAWRPASAPSGAGGGVALCSRQGSSSKASIMALPAVLVLLDVYPTEAWSARRGAGSSSRRRATGRSVPPGPVGALIALRVSGLQITSYGATARRAGPR